MKYIYEIGDSVMVTNNYEDDDYFGALAKISQVLEEKDTCDYRIVFDCLVKNGKSYTSSMNIKSEFLEPIIEKKKPLNLLKEHMDILERLTEIASKEKYFEERGQFMNIQKMIKMESEIISGLKDAYEAVKEFDKGTEE